MIAWSSLPAIGRNELNLSPCGIKFQHTVGSNISLVKPIVVASGEETLIIGA